MVYYGYIYIWYDTIKKKFCIGSHYGQVEDDYISSTGHFIKAYRKRPNTFRFRVLEYIFENNKKLIIKTEEKWLQKIKIEELGKKYYNLKNVASGGDIFSNLTEKKKEQFRKKCSESSKKYWSNISKEALELKRKTCFGGNNFSRDYLIERNKKLCAKNAIIKTPEGNEISIKNIAEFCRINNLNYGNMKTVLSKKKGTCKGYSGYYIEKI